MTLRRSPLHDRHVALGAKLGAFGGWEMPIEYANGGVLKEHTAVREAVGIFDVSHLGKISVRGSGAVDFVNASLTADLSRVGPGGAQYTLCCDPGTGTAPAGGIAPAGGVVDDLIAYRFADDHLFLVPNAANTAEVHRRLAAEAPASVTVSNEHTDHAIIAVQGPRSAPLLAELGLPSGHAYMSFALAPWEGVSVTVCRTGYTGEHGYELIIDSSRIGSLWDAVVKAGAGYDLRPAGLAARDTLRTEMGYPLHGQDLSLEISPVQARLGWAVGWQKPTFWGREALLAEKEAGPRRLLWGIESLDRGIPRPHMRVTRDDQPIGEVTSGTFSPTRRVGIGLALIDTDSGVKAGVEVEVDVRGRRSLMRVVRPPFVASSVR